MKTKSGLNVILGLLLILLLPLSVSAMEMDDCLGCHIDADAVGDDLTISEDVFQHTMHSELGCATCHDSVTDEHPDNGEAVSHSACVDCHEDVSEQYHNNAHSGNATCIDCHDPHKAFGLETLSSHAMNLQCTGCHGAEEITETHSGWLPQADLHISKLPCITCHAASESYEVVLHIIHKQEEGGFGDYSISQHDDLNTFSNGKDIRHLIDLNKDDFISLAELKSFHFNPAYKKLKLEGTLVPSEVTHNFTAMDNRYDCSFCHASGPSSMKIGYLALPNPNGTFDRIDVEERAILSVSPDFYLTGSSRNASLNIIGLIIICGGMVMPIFHGTLRFLTRKNRKH